MKKIITISREFGSAGGTIGKSVANKLGFEYYDKELIVQAARDAHITIEDLAKLDEKAPVIFGFTQSFLICTILLLKNVFMKLRLQS